MSSQQEQHQQQKPEEPAGSSPPSDSHGQPEARYRLSVIPASSADLAALKQDLIAHESLRFHLYVTVFLQNLVDYEQGKRTDVSTLIIKEP